MAVIGFARRTLSQSDFKMLVKGAVERSAGKEIPETDFQHFFKIFTYEAGDFNDKKAFESLSRSITTREKEWGLCASKLFYLAVPPESYESIFTNLAAVKLNLPCSDETGWTRILVEKPFGHDLGSGLELETLLAKYFKEEQIYRIDHYLFKEIVQGIQNFRFSNNLLETKWGKDNIERIDIRLHESIGVEARGAFYDKIGALKDVGQNHLLEMLAAITMEYPEGMDAGAVHRNREAILETLEPWSEATIKKNTYRAQYEGYSEIKGVAPNSETETYYALKSGLTHSKWSGVPIYMDSGKRLGEARKEIVLTMRHPKNCLLCETGAHGPNRITFRLEPSDEIVITFWTKKPGFEQVLEEREMSFFLYEKKNKVQYVEEYAKVIHAAIVGEQALFCSAKEVAALWRFTDPVIAGWKKNLAPLSSYVPDTLPHPAILTMPPDMEDPSRGKGAIGFIGLGKMGANLVRQISAKGWQVHGYDRSQDTTDALKDTGMIASYTLPEFVKGMPTPRAIWLMVPHSTVDGILEELLPLLEKGDTVIDGGNSRYKDSIRRHKEIPERGINFLDAGVSGGPGGALEGACVMVGGERKLFDVYEQLFKDMSVPNGYLYCGKGGAGHFVKMVHNGIEYGMMQAIAEGFTILKKNPLSPDLTAVARLYNHRSVVESRLVEWLEEAYRILGVELNDDVRASASVAASGEGQWTVEEAHELNIPVPIIEGALEFRKQSQKNPSYTGRILSAIRNQFGGHVAAKK